MNTHSDETTTLTAPTKILDLAGQAAQPGHVYLVGGGPGDPGLVTLRAAQLLATATYVAYDRLAPSGALALASKGAELVYVGKLPDRHAIPQDELNQLLVRKAKEGHAVVRFKGGDPFVFGRGSEEAVVCAAAGVRFEVVPGVTSAIAAPAYAGIPVTHRGVSPAVAVITGHEDPMKPDTQVDYPALATFPGTLVFLMGVGRIGNIAAALIDNGRAPDTPVAMVQWGTLPKQTELHATLGTVAAKVAETGFSSPAVTVVGEVAGLADQLRWFTDRPLHGKRVVVPRTRQQTSALSSQLRSLGAEPIEVPMIRIEPPSDPSAFTDEIMNLSEYDWLAVTSANGVEAVIRELHNAGLDARALAKVKIAVVGSATAAAFASFGIIPDVVPSRFTGRHLGQAIVDVLKPGDRVLLARSDIAGDGVVTVLDEAGITYTNVDAYSTVPVEQIDPAVTGAIADGTVDAVVFASSSSVRTLTAALDVPVNERVAVVSIGPVTSSACVDAGLAVTNQADPHNVEGLVAAVVTALS